MLKAASNAVRFRLFFVGNNCVQLTHAKLSCVSQLLVAVAGPARKTAQMPANEASRHQKGTALTDQTPPEARREIAFIRQFLIDSMGADPARAGSCFAPGARITFTGGQEFDSPAGIRALNAARYAHVQKEFDRFDLIDRPDGTVVVYSLGWLYGAWPDGEGFEKNRYIDRFELKDGLITRMEVWNDSAERLLTRAGLQPSA